MPKGIINKHIDKLNEEELLSKFDSDINKGKGEIVICNDSDNPTIFILNEEGIPTKISGGNEYDDTEIWGQVNENKNTISQIVETEGTIKAEIVVAGLDDKLGAGNYVNGSIIPAGTDIYTILQNILCKELYPSSVTTKTAKAAASMNNLSLTLSASGTIEVGTLVKLTEGKTNGSSVSVPQKSQIIGMDYGYSFENDSIKDSTDKQIINECYTAVTDNTFTISTKSIEGFNADSDVYVQTIPSEASSSGQASMTETNIGCVIEGTNSITLTASGAKYSYESEAISPVYYCSNLGKTDESHISKNVDAVNGETSRPTKEATASVTGAYYYFMGYSDNLFVKDFDSSSIRELTVKSGWVVKDGTTIIVGDTAIESNGKSIVIACPNKYKLSKVFDVMGLDYLNNFRETGTVEVVTGNIMTTYNVYIYPISNGTVMQLKNIELSLA